jgi:hypothetical protein
MPAKLGRVTPCLYSAGWVSDAMTSVAKAVSSTPAGAVSFIFSPPTRSVISEAPDATDCHAA